MFLLLFPLNALLLKCFYWKRLYINHLILIIHNHSFILIIYLFMYIISKIFNLFEIDYDNIITVLILLSSGIYVYISSYNYYKQGKVITLVKFLPIAMTYIVILLICSISTARLFFILPNVFN